MRWPAFILILMTAMLIQVTFMATLEVGGARPELVLLVALFFAMQLDVREAAIAGWSAGMLQDLLSGGALGTYALVFMCLAMFLSNFREELFFQHILTQVLVAFPAALLASAAALFRIAVLSASFDLGVGIERAFAAAVYTAFAAPFVFALLGLVRHPLGLFSRRDFLHV